MSLMQALTDEELQAEKLCNRCEVRPRKRGARSTWCRECYNAWQREYRAGRRRQSRVSSPVPNEAGCLIYQGAVSPNGYCYIKRNGVQRLAHRWFYEQANGPIPEGMTLDHLCEEKRCVNVAHLEPVSRGENVRRWFAKRREEGKA